jgi:glycosyltransferase involved in cell wall biosynthesis
VGIKPLVIDVGCEKKLRWWKFTTRTLTGDEVALDGLTIPRPCLMTRRRFQREVMDEIRVYDPQLMLIEGDRESRGTGLPLAKSLNIPSITRIHSIRGLWVKDITKYIMKFDPIKAVQELLISPFSKSRNIFYVLTSDYTLTLNTIEEQYLQRYTARVGTIEPTYIATIGEELTTWDSDVELGDERYVVTLLDSKAWDSIRSIIGIKVIHYVSKKVPEAKFVVIGATEEDLREGLGLKPPDNVIGMKRLNDLAFYNIIQNATIVLLPLVWLTGTSMRLVEALYFGKPVITTSVVASRLSNFANGLHCIIEDHFKRYPSHVKTLLNDDVMRYEITKNARAYFDEMLGYERTGLRHLKVFKAMRMV